ncbi:MAG: hypothetical protein ABIR16_05040 [Dokdonella sp.]
MVIVGFTAAVANGVAACTVVMAGGIEFFTGIVHAANNIKIAGALQAMRRLAITLRAISRRP